MKVDVATDDVQTLSTDDRGRVYLGKEYGNAEAVEVAVLEVIEDE